MKTKKGFTLVELLVVISIIAILLAVLIPSMNKAKETAKRVICSNGQKQVALGLAAYAADYDGLMPWYGGKDPAFAPPWQNPTPDDSERHPYMAFSGATEYREGQVPNGRPWPMRLGCLYARGVIKAAKVFYCPSNKEKSYVYESYIEPLPPDNTSREWGTLPQKYNLETNQNQWVRTGLSYFPIDLSVTRDVTAEKIPRWTARKFERVDSRIPFLADRMWNTTEQKGLENLSHNQGTMHAVNAAFKDGHVVYVRGNKTNETKAPWGTFSVPVWREFGVSGATNKEAYKRFYYLTFTAIQP